MIVNQWRSTSWGNTTTIDLRHEFLNALLCSGDCLAPYDDDMWILQTTVLYILLFRGPLIQINDRFKQLNM